MALALLCGSVAATEAQAPIQLGVAGGVGFQNVKGDDTEGADSRTTGYFGGVLVWQSAGIAGFETGVYYMPKGAEADFEGATAEIKLTYVEVPLLLRIAPTMGESAIRPVILAGGFVAFKSKCEVEGESGGVSVTIDCDEFFSMIDDETDVEAEVQSLDYGITGGLAVDIPVGERAILSPVVRYTRGLKDVLEVDGESIDAKNDGFTVGVAVRIRM
jgi:hypothetical protein